MTTDIPFQPCGPDRLADFPFDEHNAEVGEMWAAFHAKAPTRTPVFLGLGTRFYVLNHAAFNGPPDWRRYMEDADAMFEARLRFQRWGRFNVLQDFELGLPEAWTAAVDFQNVYEAAWLGCPILYSGDQVPATRPAYAENPEALMDGGIPDPFGGLLARGLEFHERFVERAARETFLSRPIEVTIPGWGWGTDGPFTVACNCVSAEFVCTAMATEPERIHRLLDFVTEAIIHRIIAWRERYGLPIKRDDAVFADDSIAIISARMYREHVLPYHQRLFDALATDVGRGMHLCGDATRHMPILASEANVRLFDTGFPVDFRWLREQLGPDCVIQGGPHVDVLRFGTSDDVIEKSRAILESGVLEGGLFMLREANNLAPETPLENTEALYRAGWLHGLAGGREKTPAIEWLNRRAGLPA